MLLLSGTLVLNTYLSILPFNAYAVPPAGGWFGGSCGAETKNPYGETQQTCCWNERVPGKLPPLNIENYCQTCIYTSYGYSCSDKVKQLTDSPFKDRVPSGTIEQSQPLTQQNPNDIEQSQPLTQQNPNEVGEEVSPLQDFSERSSSSKNSVDDNVVDNGQNKEDNAQFEESREIENNTNN